MAGNTSKSRKELTTGMFKSGAPRLQANPSVRMLRSSCQSSIRRQRAVSVSSCLISNSMPSILIGFMTANRPHIRVVMRIVQRPPNGCLSVNIDHVHLTPTAQVRFQSLRWTIKLATTTRNSMGQWRVMLQHSRRLVLTVGSAAVLREAILNPLMRKLPRRSLPGKSQLEAPQSYVRRCVTSQGLVTSRLAAWLNRKALPSLVSRRPSLSR